MRLLHFSEDPAIEMFRPHVAKTSERPERYVWAVDEAHAPGFWFPRQCPRACYWLSPDQSAPEGVDMHGVSRVHAVQSDWLGAMRACTLYAYSFAPDGFAMLQPEAGHWVAEQDIVPLGVEPVGDLFAKHADAQIPLLIYDDLRPLIAAIVGSGAQFSIYRQRNLAAPR